MKQRHAQVEKERPAHAEAHGHDALDWVRQLTYGGRGSEPENSKHKGSGSGAGTGAVTGAGAGAGADAGASSKRQGALTLARVSLAVAAEALLPVKVAIGVASAVSAGAAALREVKWLEEKIEGSAEARAKTTERKGTPEEIISPGQKVTPAILSELFSAKNGLPLADHAVGMAEGTRQKDGKPTDAYHGHKDPMCDANPTESCSKPITNLGTFSYQEGPGKPSAKTPEQADEIQRQVLKEQAQQLEEQALKKGMHLSVMELVQGVDLANQSPLAACVESLGSACKFGYIDRLKQAKEGTLPGANGPLSGLKAIAEARRWSYFDPEAMRWDAAGFGHNVEKLRADQWRRVQAVATALAQKSH